MGRWTRSGLAVGQVVVAGIAGWLLSGWVGDLAAGGWAGVGLLVLAGYLAGHGSQLLNGFAFGLGVLLGGAGWWVFAVWTVPVVAGLLAEAGAGVWRKNFASTGPSPAFRAWRVVGVAVAATPLAAAVLSWHGVAVVAGGALVLVAYGVHGRALTGLTRTSGLALWRREVLCCAAAVFLAFGPAGGPLVGWLSGRPWLAPVVELAVLLLWGRALAVLPRGPAVVLATVMALPHGILLGKGVLLLCAAGIAHPDTGVLAGALVVVVVELASVWWGTWNAASPLWAPRRTEAALLAQRFPGRARMVQEWLDAYLDREDHTLAHTVAAEARLSVMRAGHAPRGRLLSSTAVVPQLQLSAEQWLAVLDDLLRHLAVWGRPTSPGPGDVLLAHQRLALAESQWQARHHTDAQEHYQAAIALFAGRDRADLAAIAGLDLAELLVSELDHWDAAQDILTTTAADERLNPVLRQRAALLSRVLLPDAEPLAEVRPTRRDFRRFVAACRTTGLSMGMRAERAYSRRLAAGTAAGFQLGVPGTPAPVRGLRGQVRLAARYTWLVDALMDSWPATNFAAVVRQRPELLTDDAARAVDMMIGAARDGGDTRRVAKLTVVATFLHDARAHGIDTAVAALPPGGPLPVQYQLTDADGPIDLDDPANALRVSALVGHTEFGHISDERLARMSEEYARLPPDLRRTLERFAIKGADYQSAGDDQALTEAIDLGTRVLNDQRLTGQHRLNVVVDLGMLLMVRFDRTNRRDDLTLADRLLADALDDVPADYLSLPALLINRAAVLGALTATGGDPDGLDTAIDLLRRAVADPTASQTLANHGLGLAYGNRYAQTGDLRALDASVLAHDRALAAARSDSPVLPRLHEGRAIALARRHQRTRDRADLDGCVDAYRAALALTPLRRAHRLNLLGGLLNALRLRFDVTNSREDLSEAAALMPEVMDLVPDEGFQTDLIVTNLGYLDLSVYRATGDRQWLDRAVEIFAAGPATAFLRIENLTGLARALEYRGDTGDLARSVAAYREAVGEHRHPAGVLAAARAWIAAATRRSAWPEVAEAGEHALTAAHLLLTRQLDRTHKENWLRDLQELPTEVALARVRLGDPAGAALALEQGSATMLAEALRRQRIELDRLTQAGRDDLADRYRAESARLAVLTAPVDTLSAPVDPVEREAEVSAAVAALDATVEEIRTVPGYADFLHQPTLDTVTAADPHRPVYLAAGEPGGVALVVRAGEVAAVELPELTALEVRTRAEALAGSPDTVESTLDWLGHALTPLLSEVDGQVTLIPVGRLAALPLHAAPGLRDLVVGYGPNALAVVESARQAARTSVARLVAVAEPAGVDGPALPGASAEVAVAAATFDAEVLTGPHADRTRVLAALADADVVHFACHGVADPDNPWRGGVLLAGNDLLTVDDLARQGFAARLVVLSACQTAAPGAALPAEVIGLPVAVLRAGAAGVVGSLWPVRDSHALLTMTVFYEQWRVHGLTPPAALAAAQRWMRTTSDGEKFAMFDTLVDGADWLPAPAARACWNALALTDPDGRRFADPAGWAAFCYIGG